MGRLRTALPIALAALAALSVPLRAEQAPSASSTRAVWEALSLASDADHTAWRWRLARDYAARGLNAEADGVLRVIAADTPERAESPDFRLLHASVLAELGDAEAALTLLDTPAIAGRADTCRIRMRAAASLGQYATVKDSFACAKTHRVDDVILAAQADIAIGDVDAAAKRLRAIETPSARQAGAIAYWRGVIARTRGQQAFALEHFRNAEQSPHKVAALRAQIAVVGIEVETGALTPAAALARLDKLRHVRRGGAAERDLLLTAARIADRKGDVRAAFTDYATVAKYGGDAALRQTLGKRFETIFADGGTSLPPAEAFALFWDFREFAPQGPAADEMVRQLADRLSGLGLNAQAASLLEHQVYNRLEGTARSIVANRLAALLNASGFHARALSILAATANDSVPADVARERRFIEAEALIGTGKPAQAKALLAEATGDRANRLRAEAAWVARDWGAVIALMAPTVNGPQASVRDVLRLTVAATMDGDDILLRRLRGRFGDALAKTAAGPAFDALTGDPAALSPDQLRKALALAAERAALPSSPGNPA